MSDAKRFSRPVLAGIHESKILGIRAGDGPHRFTGVWAVVVDGRVFVRSWDDKPEGWHRAFLQNPRGAIQIGKREIPVRARRTRGARLMEANDRAYGEKYTTPGARGYVRGFARPRRRNTATELALL